MQGLQALYLPARPSVVQGGRKGFVKVPRPRVGARMLFSCCRRILAMADEAAG